MSYTNETEVVYFLGIDSLTPGSDDESSINALISFADALIDSLTGRTFEASEDSTRYFNAIDDVDGAILYLDHDLCAITTITNGDGVEVASDEYTTLPRNETPYHAIKLLSSSGKSWTYTNDSEGAISIAGKWAYSTTAPEDVEQTARDIVIAGYKQRDNLADATRPILTGDGNVLMPDEYPKSLKTLINRYRRVV